MSFSVTSIWNWIGVILLAFVPLCVVEMVRCWSSTSLRVKISGLLTVCGILTMGMSMLLPRMQHGMNAWMTCGLTLNLIGRIISWRPFRLAGDLDPNSKLNRGNS